MEKRRKTMKPPLPYEAQYDALLETYNAIDTAVDELPTSGAVAIVYRTQQKLELLSQMAHLSVTHGELQRALGHYEKIFTWVETNTLEGGEAKPSSAEAEETKEKSAGSSSQQILKPTQDEIPSTLRAVLPELQINVLANMSAIYHRMGDTKTAMARLLAARKAMRALREAAPTDARSDSLQQLETALAVNYALLLQSQGAVGDAMAAADATLRLTGPSPNKEKKPQQTEDQTIATARQLATEVLVSGHRIKSDSDKVQALSSQAFQGLDTQPLGDPQILARSHNNAALCCFENQAFATVLRHWLSAYRILLTSKPPDTKLQAIIRYHIGRTLLELGTTTALPTDTGSDNPVNALQCLTIEDSIISDPVVSIVAQASLGELEYYNGDFALATARLTTALTDVERLIETGRTQKPSAHASLKQELVQIQGSIESFLGNALLAGGNIDAAEQHHQRDLERALDSEDLHAQLRAVRNLAVLYHTTQRQVDAVPLWHETIEIAIVLASQRDLLVAYNGLGTTLHELRIIDSTKKEYQELLAEQGHEPRRIFLKQRALAIELGDLEAQVLAQRQVVRTYEWPPHPDELERRLEECDALVRLSEQLGDATVRAESYRVLANAITAQVARLASRGARFAEAIHVLTAKRNAVLQKVRDVIVIRKPSEAATPLRRREPLTQVTVLQR